MPKFWVLELMHLLHRAAWHTSSLCYSSVNSLCYKWYYGHSSLFYIARILDEYRCCAVTTNGKWTTAKHFDFGNGTCAIRFILLTFHDDEVLFLVMMLSMILWLLLALQGLASPFVNANKDIFLHSRHFCPLSLFCSLSLFYASCQVWYRRWFFLTDSLSVHFGPYGLYA